MLQILNLFEDNKVEDDLLHELKSMCIEDMRYLKPDSPVEVKKNISNNKLIMDKDDSSKILLFQAKSNNKDDDV